MISLKTLLTILALAIAASHVWAEQGSLQGSVPLLEFKTNSLPIDKYRGKISGRVSPAAAPVAGIWLEASSLSAPKNPPTVTLSQAHYQFTKSLIIVPIGTTVKFPNDDTDYHNIYSLSRTKRFDLGRYKKGENPAPSVIFEKAGFIELRCEIHDHMNANIIVVNTPYFTTTDAAGRFTLRGIPPGNYILHAQLTRKIAWKIPVHIISGKTSKVPFSSQ